MPSSRRQLLSVAGVSLTGVASTVLLTDRSEPTESSEYEWPMARYDPAGTGSHPVASGPKDDVEIAWKHDKTEWFHGSTQPIRLGETILAGGNGLLALASDTGERRFGYKGSYDSSPAVAPAPIYRTETLAITGSNGVYGLNSGGGHVVPGTKYRLGDERWSGPRSSAPGFLDPTEAATPVVGDGRIFTPLPGTNTLVALNPNDGSVQWQQTHHEDEATSGMYSRPVLYDSVVFATAWPGRIDAFRAENGETVWSRDIDEQMVLPPVATEAGLVVPTRHGVQLRDRTDGELLWKRDLDGNVTESTPAVADGRIFVTDEQESLHAVDLETGEILWSAPFDGRTTPVVADGIVYAVESLYTLYAFDAASGDQHFEYRPSQIPLSAPIVGDGVLYLANRRQIIALEAAE